MPEATKLPPKEALAFRGHPRALYMLFFTEMWERFSYYGMRALLVLYMVQYLGYSDVRSYAVYGSYTALVYATPVFGGMLADRLLGYKKAVVLGATIMALGHFAMAFHATFYQALGLLIVGNGFFKPNISTIVGRLYPPGDSRRDSGFTIFYMGINLGAALAPAVCGAIGQIYGWHYGFGLAGIGMLVGLCVFLWGQRWIADLAEPPNPERLKGRAWLGWSREVWLYLGTVAAVVVSWLLVQHGAWVGRLLSMLGIAVFGWLVVYLVRHANAVERDRVSVILVLTLFSVVFWAFFEQAGSSMNLFTERNVNRELGEPLASMLESVLSPFGIEAPKRIPASIFQAVNPIFILTLAPLFSALWIKLSRAGLEPSFALKFGLAILQLGLGFGVLWYGATHAATNGMVPVIWLLLGYLLHTTGELCLSPIGLSMVTKLSPAKIGGLMMGTWLLSSSFAQYVGGLIAALTGVGEPTVAGSPAAQDSVRVYGNVFGGVALVAFVVGCVLTLVSGKLARRTHGIT